MSNRQPILLHPFLLAVTPILFLYDFNKHELSLKLLIFLMGIALGATLIFLILFCILLKNASYAALITTAVVILFFSYKTFLGQIESNALKEFLNEDKNLVWCYGLVLLAAFFGLKKINVDLSPIHTFLNSVSVIAVLYIGFNITVYQIKTFKFTPKENEKTPPLINEKGQSEFMPDIYYIILDAHGREDILKTLLECNISPFISSLEKKGFFVAKRSRSNYRVTSLSLGSSLNLDYLQNIRPPLDNDGKGKTQASLYRLVENNKVVKFLKAKGYKYVHFNPNINLTETNKNADVYINFDRFNSKFLELLSNTTVIGAFDLQWTNVNDRNRKALVYNFEKLGEVHKIKGPKFVFAHFLMPHVPYVFDADGNPQPDAVANDTYNKNAYCQFATYGDKKIDQAVSQIISQSKTPPVIIIQGDHGAEFVGSTLQPPPNEIVQVFGNLNAYYLPNTPMEKLYDTISPVNSFRLIFNHYFGTQHELLKDRTFFHWDEYEEKLIEVPFEMDLNVEILPVNDLQIWIGSLQEAMKTYPDFPQGLNTIGFLYLKLKQFEEALPYFEKAIQLSSENHFVFGNAGDTLIGLKRYPEAVEMYRKAVELLPSSLIYKYNLGQAMLLSDGLSEGFNFLKKILEAKRKGT